MCEALMELMRDEIKDEVKDQLNEAKVEWETNSLKTLVDVLKSLSLDFDSAYQAIIKTETYAKVPREQMIKYWK